MTSSPVFHGLHETDIKISPSTSLLFIEPSAHSIILRFFFQLRYTNCHGQKQCKLPLLLRKESSEPNIPNQTKLISDKESEHYRNQTLRN